MNPSTKQPSSMELDELAKAAGKLAIVKKKKKTTRRKKRSFKKCHQTLNTTELLEAILVQLPIKDLLFAQGICQTWKNCIKASPRLQQGLFFQLPEDTPATDVVPILLSRPLDQIKSTDEDLADIRSTAINPLLRKMFDKNVLAGKYIMGLGTPALKAQTKAMRRPEASWQRMHLCYPEVATVDIDDFFYKFWRMGMAMPFVRRTNFTPKLKRHMMSTIKPHLCLRLGNMVSWMQECETAAELEAHIDGNGWEDIDDDEE